MTNPDPTEICDLDYLWSASIAVANNEIDQAAKAHVWNYNAIMFRSIALLLDAANLDLSDPDARRFAEKAKEYDEAAQARVLNIIMPI